MRPRMIATERDNIVIQELLVRITSWVCLHRRRQTERRTFGKDGVPDEVLGITLTTVRAPGKERFQGHEGGGMVEDYEPQPSTEVGDVLDGVGEQPSEGRITDAKMPRETPGISRHSEQPPREFSNSLLALKLDQFQKKKENYPLENRQRLRRPRLEEPRWLSAKTEDLNL
ncbi:hypothetical protein K439DRAFT_1612483 [Ramaria rubella]|nr:hypothetical protein K439DRAFT_1612483 [Ramaria rubella]